MRLLIVSSTAMMDSWTASWDTVVSPLLGGFSEVESFDGRRLILISSEWQRKSVWRENLNPSQEHFSWKCG